jgi:hypothetical protein
MLHTASRANAATARVTRVCATHSIRPSSTTRDQRPRPRSQAIAHRHLGPASHCTCRACHWPMSAMASSKAQCPGPPVQPVPPLWPKAPPHTRLPHPHRLEGAAARGWLGPAVRRRCPSPCACERPWRLRGAAAWAAVSGGHLQSSPAAVVPGPRPCSRSMGLEGLRDRLPCLRLQLHTEWSGTAPQRCAAHRDLARCCLRPRAPSPAAAAAGRCVEARPLAATRAAAAHTQRRGRVRVRRPASCARRCSSRGAAS